MRLVKTPATKLTKEEAGTLRDLVDRSTKNDAAFFRRCTQLRDLLRGKHWKDDSKMKSAKVTVNLIHSHVRTLVPTLFFQDPYMECVSDDIRYRDSVPAWEGLINLVVRKTDYKEETKKCVMDGILYGEGWKKWVVTQEDEYTEKEKEPTSESGYSGPSAWFAKGTPAGLRISPTQVIVDYNSPDRDLRNARFVAFRYRKLISEIKADPRYTIDKDWKTEVNTTEINKASRTAPGEDRETIANFWDENGNENQTSGEYVTLTEVWVYQLVELKLYKQVVVLVEDHEGVVRGPEPWDSYYGKSLKTFPVNRIIFNPVPDEPPVSEVSTWRSLQQTLNYVLSRVTSYVELSKQIYTFDPTKVKNPAKAIKQFERGSQRELIEISEPDAIMPVMSHQVPADNYQLISMLNQFITQVGGVGPNQRGSTGARTATEASIIQNNSGIKMGEKEDTVAEFIKRDGEILVALLRETVDSDFVFRATGQTGSVTWQRFTDFEKAWSPDIQISPASFTKDVDMTRLQNYMQAYQMALGLLPVYGPQIVRLDGLVNLIFKEMKIPTSANVVSNTLSEEVAQMTEIVDASIGVTIEVKPTDNHMVHYNVIQAFINSESGQRLAENNPAAYETLVEHSEMHMQIMQQQQAMSVSGPRSGDAQGGPGSTPASTANEETAEDRETASPYPQGGRAL